MFEIVMRTTDETSGMHTHHHNCYEIVFVLSGQALFTIGGKEYRAQRGGLLFISNLETHFLSVESAPYERCYALIGQEFFHSAVQDPVLASVFRNRPGHFSHMAQLPEEAIEPTRALFEQMIGEYARQGEYWREAVKCSLQLLFIRLYRQMREFFPLKALTRTTEAILQIQKRIEERCEEPYTLKEAARQSYIELHYLSKLFKSVTGFTFQQYQIRQRVARAKGLLCRTGDSVAKIGAAAGFQNASHFIRMFKKMEGVTPSQYRKMAVKEGAVALSPKNSQKNERRQKPTLVFCCMISL